MFKNSIFLKIESYNILNILEKISFKNVKATHELTQKYGQKMKIEIF